MHIHIHIYAVPELLDPAFLTARSLATWIEWRRTVVFLLEISEMSIESLEESEISMRSLEVFTTMLVCFLSKLRPWSLKDESRKYENGRRRPRRPAAR